MRKIVVIAMAGAVALAIVPAAQAANVYTVDGNVLPARSGTTAAPKPATVKFNFTVANSNSALRPELIRTYQISFGPGVKQNPTLFTRASERCTEARAVAGTCPTSAKIGSGIVNNLAGPPTDLSLKIPCNLKLTLYNGGGNRMILHIKGAPPECPLGVNNTIRATFVTVGGGSAVRFTVPPALLHPGGLDNSVVVTTSSIFKAKFVRTRRRVGSTFRFVNVQRGFFETTSCPASRKRPISTTFTAEPSAANPSPVGVLVRDPRPPSCIR